jgi:hypothetical protein
MENGIWIVSTLYGGFGEFISHIGNTSGFHSFSSFLTESNYIITHGILAVICIQFLTMILLKRLVWISWISGSILLKCNKLKPMQTGSLLREPV